MSLEVVKPGLAQAHHPRVDIAALLANPGAALALDNDVAAVLLGQVASLHALLAARVAATVGTTASTAPQPVAERLLTAHEVAARLSVSKDWVYRAKLPFAVRLDGHVRFKASGLERYLKTR